MFKKELNIILDSSKNQYLVIDILREEINEMLDVAKNNIDNFHDMHDMKLQRDNGFYHLTVLTTPEFGRINKNQDLKSILDENIKKQFSFSILGIGHASNSQSECYFGVVASDDLNKLRNDLNLPLKDFHITLGFDKKDVHFDDQKNPIRKHEIIYPFNETINKTSYQL